MSSFAAPNAALADGLPTPRRYQAIAALLAAISMTVLDGGIANLALPSIAQVLNVDAAASVWIVTAYQLALVALLFPLSALAERVGLKRVFIGGVMMFSLASLGCALASNLTSLVISRALQGAGASAIMCVSAGIVRLTYPKRLLGRGIGINALCVALNSALAPSLGAAILTYASWPWLFAINLPISVLVLLMFRALPTSPRASRRLDPLSVMLNIGLFCMGISGLERLAEQPLLGVPLLMAATGCLVALLRHERSNPAPLLPVDLLQYPLFRHAMLASLCAFAAQMLCFIALPFYLQHQLGFTPLHTGALMMAWPLAVAVAAQVSGRLADVYPPQRLCVFGGLGIAAGLAGMALWPMDEHSLPLVLFLCLSGIGFGFFQVPNNRVLLTSTPQARSGATGGMQAAARQTGMALGAALIAVLLGLLPDQAPRTGLAIAAVLAMLSAAVSAKALRHRTE
ncbi:DHA2 family multidrug resistance protein-like MFS transporter [Pseudomonas duriflava]|uniref:DHA2 family multidrug resistance protein-like MFS transporter n=1 Tax=Pseudomonas duriflava TaxID=459528 RepID=A0A562QE26_9PSED|nr:MFS transporter [Pseudomonas duriflava]TWI55007.1 DHA2 family multidrug resistance protein-like MFS transporter [Pseudomonas duriflava]